LYKLHEVLFVLAQLEAAAVYLNMHEAKCSSLLVAQHLLLFLNT